MYADFVRQQNDKIDGNWHLIPKRMIFSSAEIGKYRQRLTFFSRKKPTPTKPLLSEKI
jgi:hypothetical protein